MLNVNIANLSHAELAAAVSRSCAPYGEVTEITILQPPDQPQVAFALVGMASEAAIDRVVANLGAVRMESLAIIRVEHATPAGGRKIKAQIGEQAVA